MVKKQKKQTQTGLMPTGFHAQAEPIQWIAWGKAGDKDNPYVVKEDEPLIVLVTEIKKSNAYSRDEVVDEETGKVVTPGKNVYIYSLRTKGCTESDPTLLVMPPTDLQKKLDTPRKVVVGDVICIIYRGDKKTGKGKPMKLFEVGVQ
jgi:hypothetical protein